MPTEKLESIIEGGAILVSLFGLQVDCYPSHKAGKFALTCSIVDLMQINIVIYSFPLYSSTVIIKSFLVGLLISMQFDIA